MQINFLFLFCVLSFKMSEINIFSRIMENSSDSKSDEKKPPKDKKSESNKNNPKNNSSTPKDSVNSVPIKTKDSSSNLPSTSDGFGNFEKMGFLMTQGFKDIASSIEKMGTKMSETMNDKFDILLNREYDEDYEESEEETAETSQGQEPKNLFDTISSEIETEEKTGMAVNSSLAKLVDKFLKEKLSESAYKAKEESYPRPDNIKFSCVPKVNKPVWEAMSRFNKKNDAQLQNIQKSFLKSTMPVTKVISKLHEARDNPESLDIDSLIMSLTDSLAFIGSANVDMVKKRKELIKSDLPKNMQGLCGEIADFSSTCLFGDELGAKIKEVAELNKISNKFNFGASARGSSSRGASGRGRVRSFSRSWRGKKTGRYAPYNPNARTDHKKQPLNCRGPSHQ